MNKKQLQAAAKNYVANAKEMTKDEFADYVRDQETEEVAAELVEFLYPTEPIDKPASKPAKVVKADYFEEWRVEIKNKQAEKLRRMRPVVKITEDEAETLNAGILNGPNTYGKMYFRPE